MTKKETKAFLDKIKTIGISTGAKPGPKKGYTIVPVSVHVLPCPICFTDHSKPSSSEQSFSA